MKSRENDRKFANTLARGLSVLSAFRAHDQGLSHAEIAERTGLPKPTTSRLTYTLCELGFLSHGHRNDRFRPGPALLALGSVVNITSSAIELAADPMQALADETGTLGLAAARIEDRMMLVRTWRPAGDETIWLEPGQRIPVFGSSSGQAVLAVTSDQDFEAMEPDEKLRAFRQNGFEQLLERGFTIAPAETRYAETVTSVSVPFFSESLGGLIGFSCGAVPSPETDAALAETVGPKLRALVRGLETRKGVPSALSRRA